MNPKLPKNAKLLSPPVTREIGGWAEMQYDATVQRLGLTWLRVKDGFGDSGEREDWVADIPAGCLSVTRYRGEPWKSGFTEYTSFESAILGEIKGEMSRAEDRVKEKNQEAFQAQQTVELLRRALMRARD